MWRVLTFFQKVIRINQVFSTARILLLGFIILILGGTALLSLPISSRDGAGVSLITALFTAASAICVTGLTVVDTFTAWSTFGLVVIACLTQIGGLGFMTIISTFFFLTKKKISNSQRLLIMTSLNLKDMKGIIRLVRHIFIGALIFEGIGAFVLWIRFSFDYGIWKGLGMGVFHSIMAFCNAGFDLMGEIKPFSSLSLYSGDVVISITVMLLIIIGGMGFFVWEDIWQNRRFKRLHFYSKMVITITVILILSGWLLFYITERSNPETIGNMTTGDAIFASLFQSVSTRSGGLSMLHQTMLTDISKMVTMILMFIGGSAGSTSGGIKNVTAGILVLSAISSLRNRRRVSAFGRTIRTEQILSALSVTLMAMAACFISSIAICLIQDIPYIDVLFETVSAMGTVGLSTGITPILTPLSQIIIIILMFFGRVGIMTIGMAAMLSKSSTEKVKYPDTWIMMG